MSHAMDTASFTQKRRSAAATNAAMTTQASRSGGATAAAGPAKTTATALSLAPTQIVGLNVVDTEGRAHARDLHEHMLVHDEVELHASRMTAHLDQSKAIHNEGVNDAVARCRATGASLHRENIERQRMGLPELIVDPDSGRAIQQTARHPRVVKVEDDAALESAVARVRAFHEQDKALKEYVDTVRTTLQAKIQKHALDEREKRQKALHERTSGELEKLRACIVAQHEEERRELATIKHAHDAEYGRIVSTLETTCKEQLTTLQRVIDRKDVAKLLADERRRGLLKRRRENLLAFYSAENLVLMDHTAIECILAFYWSDESQARGALCDSDVDDFAGHCVERVLQLYADHVKEDRPDLDGKAFDEFIETTQWTVLPGQPKDLDSAKAAMAKSVKQELGHHNISEDLQALVHLHLPSGEHHVTRQSFAKCWGAFIEHLIEHVISAEAMKDIRSRSRHNAACVVM